MRSVFGRSQQCPTDKHIICKRIVSRVWEKKSQGFKLFIPIEFGVELYKIVQDTINTNIFTDYSATL